MPAVDVTVYNSQVKLRELVHRERQSELAFEGGSFYDIRRWDILGTVMNGQVYGANDRWPIPQGEILSNPAMAQNDLY